MYPTLFKVGSFEFGTFGLTATLGFLAAYLIFRAEMKRRKLKLKIAADLLVAAVIGGLVGARVNFILEYWDAFLAEPWSFIWSRYGFTWWGGLAGGTLAVILVLLKNKEKLGPYADAVAPAVALGYVFGRCG